MDRYFKYTKLKNMEKIESEQVLQSIKDGMRACKPPIFSKIFIKIAIPVLVLVVIFAAFLIYYINLVSRLSPFQASSNECSISIVRNGSEKAVKSTEEILRGDVIFTYDTELVLKEKKEDTTITIGRDSTIKLPLKDMSPVFTLQKGELAAIVAKQQAGRVFIVQTPFMEITVVGTAFDVKTDDEDSTVSVEKGTVRVKNLSDGSEELVTAGYLKQIGTKASLVAVKINELANYRTGANAYSSNTKITMNVTQLYPSGRIEKITYYAGPIEIASETFAKDGDSLKKTGTIPDGTIYQYYKENILFLEVKFKDGEKNGLQKAYYENGSLLAEGNYIDGKQDGLQRDYYQNGKIKQEKTFKYGKQYGVTKLYDQNGKLKAEVNFEDGSK